MIEAMDDQRIHGMFHCVGFAVITLVCAVIAVGAAGNNGLYIAGGMAVASLGLTLRTSTAFVAEPGATCERVEWIGFGMMMAGVAASIYGGLL